MARQVINNSETGLLCRTKINDNFIETYNCFTTVNANSAFYVLDGGNSSGSNLLIGTNDNFNLALETNGSPRITILNTGNVGIGTSTPNATLTVVGNISAVGNAVFESQNSSPTVRITQSTSGTGHALLVEDQNNPDATPFVINQHGAVGIGIIPTNSPSNGPRLKVSGDLQTDSLNSKDPKYFPEVNKFIDDGYNRYFYSGNGGLVNFLGGGDGVTQNSLVYNFSPYVITAENFDQGNSVSVNPFTVARIEYNGTFYNTSYTQNLYPTTINSNFTVVGNITATNAVLNGNLHIVYATETKAAPTIQTNTLTLDLSLASLFYVNLDANITTFNIINTPPSPRVCSFTLQFVGDGTSRSVVWPTGTRWSSGLTPLVTSTLNKVDTFTFFTHDGGANWFAFVSDKNQ